MRFGLTHRIMTSILAALGVLAIATSGELGNATSLFLVSGLAVALAIPTKWQAHAILNRVATVASVAGLALQVLRIAQGTSLLEAATEYAVVLQIFRLATRRGATHDRQIIVLAWLHMIVGTVLGGGLAYAACFLVFLVIAPCTLAISHLRREVEDNYRQGARDRAGFPVDVPRILRSRRVIGKKFVIITSILSIPIFLFSAVLFIAFPRVGMSLLLVNRPTSGRIVGFSDHVDLGEVGSLRIDPTIVLRAEIPDLPSPPPERISLYLRGTALDTYDGRAWSRSRTTRVPAERVGSIVHVLRYPNPVVDKTMVFDLEPIDPPVLFLPPNTAALRVRPRGQPVFGSEIEVLRGPEAEYRYLNRDNRGISYEAYLTKPSERHVLTLPQEDRSNYLGLPKLSQRVAALSAEWTARAATPLQKAQAVEARLTQEYEYDMNSPSGASDDPLDHFLFESKKGHCEFFSTAMAILLRQAGVPTRNVTGFVGGTYNRFGSYYSIRQGDAHSWVEAYLEDQGWTRFDPTPPAGTQSLLPSTGIAATLRDMFEAVGKTWDRRVVRYDIHQQIWLFSSIRRQFLRTHRSIGSNLFDARTNQGSSASPLAVLGVAAACGIVGIVLWRRFRRHRNATNSIGRPELPPDAIAATELYKKLQHAMSAARIPRSPGTPPLKHAQQLLAGSHPCAKAVHEVTCAYLGARFGNDQLSNTQRQRLAAIIHAVRRQNGPNGKKYDRDTKESDSPQAVADLAESDRQSDG